MQSIGGIYGTHQLHIETLVFMWMLIDFFILETQTLLHEIEVPKGWSREVWKRFMQTCRHFLDRLPIAVKFHFEVRLKMKRMTRLVDFIPGNLNSSRQRCSFRWGMSDAFQGRSKFALP